MKTRRGRVPALRVAVDVQRPQGRGWRPLGDILLMGRDASSADAATWAVERKVRPFVHPEAKLRATPRGTEMILFG